MEIFAADPSGKNIFDCTYDNDKKKYVVIVQITL
jgi:hypothetical protein